MFFSVLVVILVQTVSFSKSSTNCTYNASSCDPTNCNSTTYCFFRYRLILNTTTLIPSYTSRNVCNGTMGHPHIQFEVYHRNQTNEVSTAVEVRTIADCAPSMEQNNHKLFNEKNWLFQLLREMCRIPIETDQQLLEQATISCPYVKLCTQYYGMAYGFKTRFVCIPANMECDAGNTSNITFFKALVKSFMETLPCRINKTLRTELSLETSPTTKQNSSREQLTSETSVSPKSTPKDTTETTEKENYTTETTASANYTNTVDDTTANKRINNSHTPVETPTVYSTKSFISSKMSTPYSAKSLYSMEPTVNTAETTVYSSESFISSKSKLTSTLESTFYSNGTVVFTNSSPQVVTTQRDSATTVSDADSSWFFSWWLEACVLAVVVGVFLASFAALVYLLKKRNKNRAPVVQAVEKDAAIQTSKSLTLIADGHDLAAEKACFQRSQLVVIEEDDWLNEISSTSIGRTQAKNRNKTDCDP